MLDSKIFVYEVFIMEEESEDALHEEVLELHKRPAMASLSKKRLTKFEMDQLFA
jgi:hypothetical protein